MSESEESERSYEDSDLDLSDGSEGSEQAQEDGFANVMKKILQQDIGNKVRIA